MFLTLSSFPYILPWIQKCMKIRIGLCMWRLKNEHWLFRWNCEQKEPDLIESNCIPFCHGGEQKGVQRISNVTYINIFHADRVGKSIFSLHQQKCIAFDFQSDLLKCLYVYTFIDFCDKNEFWRRKTCPLTSTFIVWRQNTWTHVNAIHHLSSNNQNQKGKAFFFLSRIPRRFQLPTKCQTSFIQRFILVYKITKGEKGWQSKC